MSKDETLTPAYKMLLSLPNELSSRGLLISFYNITFLLIQKEKLKLKWWFALT
jgi:hypothetical protein